MPIRILLADDHVLFRRGLRRILEEEPEFEIVAETGSGIEAVELARRLQPDVAVLDIAMKELNGVEATRQTLRHSPSTAVMILSMHSDERYVIRSVKAGARGYVLKDSVEEGLIRAIHLLHKGQAFFSPAVARIFQERFVGGPAFREVDDRYEMLTERERQIYHLLAEGHSSKEIATRLGISVHTAETHRTHIMEKLGLHGIAELVLSAVRRGLIS
ncbi:MAG: response regulator transcription factor [Acidobacteriota bacterium]